MKRIGWVTLILLLFAAALTAQQTQSEEAAKESTASKSVAAYKLDYVLREMQGTKAINTRQYSALVEEGKRGEMKIGTKVPVPTIGNQFQYIDVGINLSFTVQSTGGSVGLNTMLEMSSVSASDEDKPQATQLGAPLVRQVRTNFATVVHEGQPTVIGSVDDVTSTKHYEISVTATKVK